MLQDVEVRRVDVLTFIRIVDLAHEHVAEHGVRLLPGELVLALAAVLLEDLLHFAVDIQIIVAIDAQVARQDLMHVDIELLQLLDVIAVHVARRWDVLQFENRENVLLGGHVHQIEQLRHLPDRCGEQSGHHRVVQLQL